MSKQQIKSDKAPAALGSYSQGIRANGFLFCAGQLGTDPATGQLAEGGVKAQTTQALHNLEAVLGEAGLGLADIVKTTCFLAEIADFAQFNEAYTALMPQPAPARSTFAVKALPKDGAVVEIEAIAAVRDA